MSLRAIFYGHEWCVDPEADLSYKHVSNLTLINLGQFYNHNRKILLFYCYALYTNLEFGIYMDTIFDISYIFLKTFY